MCEVFHEVLGLVLLGHSEQNETTSAKTSAQNSLTLHKQNWRHFREKHHDEVLQGDPRQHVVCLGEHQLWVGAG